MERKISIDEQLHKAEFALANANRLGLDEQSRANLRHAISNLKKIKAEGHKYIIVSGRLE